MSIVTVNVAAVGDRHLLGLGELVVDEFARRRDPVRTEDAGDLRCGQDTQSLRLDLLLRLLMVASMEHVSARRLPGPFRQDAQKVFLGDRVANRLGLIRQLLQVGANPEFPNFRGSGGVACELVRRILVVIPQRLGSDLRVAARFCFCQNGCQLLCTSPIEVPGSRIPPAVVEVK